MVTNPINSGTAEQEQNGVTMPSNAASKETDCCRWNLAEVVFCGVHFTLTICTTTATER